MKHLLHGDDHVRSRDNLKSLTDRTKKENSELVFLNGQKIDLTDLKQALETQSLFANNRLVVVENIFSRKESKEKKELIAYLVDNDFTTDLLVWEKKELTPAKLKKLSNWQTKKYKLPAALFKLLDSLQPQQTKTLFTILQQVKKSVPVELLFFMIIRRVRELIIAKDLGKEGLRGAPWQIGKLVSQVSKFELKQLKDIYQKLLKIDFANKTGKSIMDLEYNLDLLLLEF